MTTSSENNLPDSQRLHEILRGYYVHEMNDIWFRWKAYGLFKEIVEKRGCKSVNQPASCVVFKYYLMIVNFLENYISDINTESKNLKHENLLKFFVEKWTIFEAATIKLDLSYRPFREYFTNRDQRYLNDRIYSVALVFWQTHSKNISRRVVKEVLKMIDKERSGQVTSTSLVQDSMRLLVHIDKEVEKSRYLLSLRDVPLRMFDTEFLYFEKTTAFYKLQSAEMILQYNAADYIRKVKNVIFQETNNCKWVYCMQEFVVNRIRLSLSIVFIKNHLSTLVTHFCEFLAANKESIHKDFYFVMSGNPELYELFSTCFHDRVIHDGKCIMENRAQEFLNHPELYIAAVLQITKKYIALVKTCFEGNEYFSKANKKALSSILKEKSTVESAKLFAIYCDYVLRNPQADMCIRDTGLVYIFECLEDKLVFGETFYELLVESLMSMTSVNEQYETDLLYFLEVFWEKYHCSPTGVNIKEIIRDIKTSDNLSEKFSNLTDPDIEFNVKVLKYESWPFSRHCSVETVPRSLSIKSESFSEYYNNSYSNRKLTFLHQISRADVTAHCFKKRYTFHLNLNQLRLLLEFNKAESLSIKKLLEGMKINEKHFNRILQNFIEVGLVKYEEDTENPDCKTNVMLNLNYENEKEYVILNEFKNEIRENKRNDYIISEENKYYAIQAAIVRIMKNKLFLHHEELVAQTFQVLKTKFVFTTDMVDKSIKKLIERNYIGRSQESERHYVYIP